MFDLLLMYFLNGLILIGWVYIIHRIYRDTVPGSIFFSALGLKVVSGILLGIVFQVFYYGGDTWIYFNQATALASQPWQAFWVLITEPTVPSEPVRAIYFTRITAILLYLTKANYWVASVYFSLFSFCCCLGFLSAIKNCRDQWFKPAIAAFLFFPTAFFWSAGMLKESLAFGSLLWLMGGYLNYESRGTFRWTQLWLCIPILILAMLKYYILAVLIPLFSYLIIFHELKRRNILEMDFWKKSVFVFMAISLPAYLILTWLHPYLEVEKFIRIVIFSHEELLGQASVENAVPPLQWVGGFLDQGINFVYYLFTGLFRPLPFDSVARMGWFSVVENTLVLIFVIWKMSTIKWSQMHPSSVGMAMIIFILALAFFLAFTIPNLGALARFKVYYMPFFMFMILIDHPVFDKISKYKILRGL